MTANGLKQGSPISLTPLGLSHVSMDQNQSAKHLYHVILEGDVVDAKDKQIVAAALAKQFNLTEAKCIELLDGQPKIIRRDMAHREAYQLQQALLQLGAKAQLQVIAAFERPVDYSLVPEGEEQSSFEDLNQRLQQGELVACSRCGTAQPLAPRCIECGSQLIARKIVKDDATTKRMNSRLVGISITLLFLLCAALIAIFR